MMMMVMMIMLTSSKSLASESSPTSGEYETIISDTISDISEFTEHQVNLKKSKMMPYHCFFRMRMTECIKSMNC